jgi:tetratricopeptide (TPR) repeat protein
MRLRILGIVVLLTVAGALPVPAAPATSDANGTVVDASGQPVQDVVVRFTPAGGGTSYEGKTNQKGKYFVSGMFNPTPDDHWKIEVVAAGWVPTSMHVESRNINRTLQAEPYTTKIKFDAPIPTVLISRFGVATIDLTLSTEESVAAERQAAAEAAAAAAAAAAGQPPPTPQKDSWNEALTLAAAGDTAGAVPLLREAIEEKPDDPERHRTLAKVLLKTDQPKEAIVEAQRAVELEPDLLDNHLVLASAYVEQENRAAAKKALEAARVQFPTETKVVHQIASLAAEDGDTAGAIAGYESITQIDPQDSDAWVSLGSLYAKTGKIDKSEAAFQKVVTLDPAKAPQVFYNIGALALNNPKKSDEDVRKAIAAFKRSIELKPDYPPARKQLGYALLQSGDSTGAKTQLAEYVRLAPNAPDAAQIQSLLKSLK